VSAAALLLGLVVAISDGDTLTLLDDQKRQVKIRLAEIDAPEKKQPFGTRSRQSLGELCHEKRAEVRVTDRDRYGRTVGRVSCAGVDANAEQVRRGMAWVYDQYAHDQNLFTLQREAQDKRRGLWADAHPVRPSDWRRGSPASNEQTGVVPASFNTSPTATPASEEFTCGSKRTCGQMSSCAEARLHLTQCGVSRLDRDGDGVPCEALCRL